MQTEKLKTLIACIMRGNVRGGEGVAEYMTRMVEEIRALVQPEKPVVKGRPDKKTENTEVGG